MTAPTGRGEDPQAILREAIALLEAFLTSTQAYAISHDSLRLLVNTFSERLNTAATRGQALPLLRTWRAQLPAAKAAAFSQARQVRFPDGGQLTLFTENEAARIASFCPDRPQF